jgi:hypothetical protein
MPIQFVASTQDSSGNAIDKGETLDGFDRYANLFSTHPIAPVGTKVSGNAQRFLLTVTEIPTQQTNLVAGLADFSVFLLGQALDLKVENSPPLESCARTEQRP